MLGGKPTPMGGGHHISNGEQPFPLKIFFYALAGFNKLNTTPTQTDQQVRVKLSEP